MKKIRGFSKLAIIGVVAIVGICAVSADASARAWTLSFSGSVDGFLDSGFYSDYHILTSRLKPTANSSAKLNVTPYKNSKQNGAKMTTVSFTNLKSGVTQLKQHTTSATGNTYYIHMKNNNNSLNANYNTISSNVVQQ